MEKTTIRRPDNHNPSLEHEVKPDNFALKSLGTRSIGSCEQDQGYLGAGHFVYSDDRSEKGGGTRDFKVSEKEERGEGKISKAMR